MPPKSGSPASQSAGNAVSDTASSELAVYIELGQSSSGASVPASSSVLVARLAADAVRVYAEAAEEIVCGYCIRNRASSLIATCSTTTASLVGYVVDVPEGFAASPITPAVSPPVVVLPYLPI